MPFHANNAFFLLKKLISIPSFSLEETKAVDWLEYFLKKKIQKEKEIIFG